MKNILDNIRNYLNDEEIIDGAIKQKFIKTKELTESQFKLLNKIATTKINKNLEEIEKT